MVRVRYLAVLAWLMSSALFVAAACSSSDEMADLASDSELSPEQGGQTGSLIPTCGIGELRQGALEIPEGDAALVLYQQDCDPGAAPMLFTSDGMPVPFSLEPAEASSASLVRTTDTLVEGEYTAVLPTADGEPTTQVIKVGPASPLPTQLGELKRVSTDTACGSAPSYEIALTDEALAYAAFLGMTVSINGQPPQLWVPFGTLDATAKSGNTLLLPPLPCGGACDEAGAISVELTADIAGESLELPPLGDTFEVTCPEPEADDTESCSTSPKGGSPLQLLALGLLTVVLARRRSTR